MDLTLRQERVLTCKLVGWECPGQLLVDFPVTADPLTQNAVAVGTTTESDQAHGQEEPVQPVMSEGKVDDEAEDKGRDR